MFSILIEKELKSIILSPKFFATFAVCSVLILLSVFIGIQEYRATVKSYEAGRQLTDQEMQEKSSWFMLSTRVFRQPDPMQVFVSGINNDIGRFSNIRSSESVKLTNSSYSDDPIFAVFRFLDFTLIVQIVLSLFAILFTYDAINGERESGTLQLAFSNAIPRFKYIFAKFVGSWLGLTVPMLVPILLSLLFIIIFRIPFAGDHWLRLIALLVVSLIYFTSFIALGVGVSALTKKSSLSFLLLLVAWVIFALIIPRIGVMSAAKIISVPSVAEIDGQLDGYSRARWDNYMKEIEQTWDKRNKEMAGMTKEQQEAYRDEHLWDWMQENDQSRKTVQADITEFSRTLHENLRNRKAVQERLAFSLSRFSPASAYQLTCMNLAGTDIRLKDRYETAMEQYQKTFVDYAEQKQKESGGAAGGIRIEFNSDTGMKFDLGKRGGALDASDMPRFQEARRPLSQIVASTILDFGLLIFFTIISLTGAFVAFLRYDVR